MRKNKLIILGLLTALSFANSNISNAQSWGDVAFSGTLNANELCYTDGKDINCDAGLLVNDPSASLIVPGIVSATAFVGDGASLTNITAGAVSIGIDDLTDGKTDSESAYPSVYLGFNAGLNDDGSNSNLGLGLRALESNVGGGDNTAIGHLALLNNTSGDDNTAVGRSAMSFNNTGKENVALGWRALYANTNGMYNTAVGYQAAASITTQWGTTAVGHGAMRSATGDRNTAVGKNTLLSVSGENNVAVGSTAGVNMSSAEWNTLLGYGAGREITTGDRNIMIGYRVTGSGSNASDELNIGNTIYGLSISSTVAKIGINNQLPNATLDVSGTVSATAFVGDGASLTNLPGGLWTDNTDYINYDDVRFYKSGSVPSGYSNGDYGFVWYPDKRAFVGGQAGYSGMFNDGNIGDVSFAFGHNTIASGNNSFAFGTNASATGTGSISFGGGATADYALAIRGNATATDAISMARYGGATGSRSVAIGSSGALNGGAQAYGLASVALGTGSDAYSNYGVAIGSGSSVSGTSAIAFTSARADGLNSIAMGKSAFVSGDYSMVIGLADVTGTEVTDANTLAILGGEVGIGLVSPNVELDVSGSIEYTGTLADVSDRRLKQNIQPLPSELDNILQVKPVSFEMKSNPSVTELGVIAQELEKVYPDLVNTANDEMGTKSVNYIGLIAPLIKAVQEQQAQIEALKEEIKILKNK